MTELSLAALLGLVGEYGDLLSLAVFNYLCGNGSAVNVRSAGLYAVISAYCEDLVESDGIISVYVELLDEDLVACLYLILLSACFNYCVHL